MKRFQLLLLAATLVLSSFKADESTVKPMVKTKPTRFYTSQYISGSFGIGNSEFGYNTIVAQAQVNYYTVFGSPNKNVITAIIDHAQDFSSQHMVTSTNGSTVYRTECRVDNTHSTVSPNGSSATLRIDYEITYTKTERPIYGSESVTTSRSYTSHYLSASAGQFNFEIAN